jgi:adenylate cyclase
MGDAVNLGSRLEGLTKEYGIKIMISKSTKDTLTPGMFFTRDLDHIRVKGKHEPVQVFEVIRPDKLPESKLIEFCEMFSAARVAYRGKNWTEAKKLLDSCLTLVPDDKASELYLKRVAAFQSEDPGDSWDGVFTYTHK